MNLIINVNIYKIPPMYVYMVMILVFEIHQTPICFEMDNTINTHVSLH